MDSWFKFDVEKLERELKQREALEEVQIEQVKRQQFESYLNNNGVKLNGLGKR